MKYIFLTDIDATLIKTGLPLSEEVREAALGFINAGGYLGLATGRAGKAAEAVAKAIPVNCPCAVLTGAVLYDYNLNRTIQKTPINDGMFELLHKIYKSDPEISITLYTENEIFNLRLNQKLQISGVFEDRTAPLITLDKIKAPIYKVLLTSHSIEKLVAVKQDTERDGQLHMTAASRHFYEITAKGVSKGTALKKIKEYLGGDCMVFAAGDGETDLAMRQYADVFYVPETASETVKKHAHIIIPPPIENGMCKAFEHATGIIGNNRSVKS